MGFNSVFKGLKKKLKICGKILGFWRPLVHLNKIQKFRFYIKENTPRLHYKDKYGNAVQGNISSLLLEICNTESKWYLEM
jgi:hypothetical protein